MSISLAPTVIPLIDAHHHVGLVGGKARALGQLLLAGFRVPNGFVVSTRAGARMSSALQAEILAQFDALQTPLVAVRSSAVGEDGATAAWAGQLDTFLNTTRETLLQNIESCWRSVNSARAQSYAQQHSLKVGGVGVVVQSMIQSEVSGVAFSVHPVTKNMHHIIIEAARGLGEAIVSGAVTPDTYITDKTSHSILEKHIATQTKHLAWHSSGDTQWHTTNDGHIQKLSDSDIQSLSQTVQALEQHFRHPVDVEWGHNNGNLYILQSRPITTL